MYKNNIYIENHEEVAAMGGDIGVCLDKYDHKHGLKHNDLARAQYCHWRATVTGVPELLSMPYKNLLIENGFLQG
jgi:cupin superfamily acireductone dioxygenase involved in methionine salvage